MNNLFNNTVTISVKEYKELIEKSQRYEILFNVVFHKFKGIFDDVWDYLKSIDWERVAELTDKENDEEE